MGYDSSASLWVGLRVSEDALYQERRTRGCSHDTPHTNRFCHKCGQPVWKTVGVPFKGFDEDMEYYKGWDVGHIGDCEDGMRIVGKRLGVANRSCHETTIDLDWISHERAAMREVLEGAPFFKEDAFGVWLVFDEPC